MAADGSCLTPWFAAGELAGLPGMPTTDRNVRARAEREGWQSRPRAYGKGLEYALASLPAATQAALLLRNRAPQAAAPAAPPAHRSADQIASAWRRYDAVKLPLKQEAQRRLTALHAVQKIVSGGVPLMQARALVADQLQRDGVRGVSAVSIARWQAAVDGAAPCDWLALLVPHYAGRTATADIEPEAWELFKADYLRLEKPSASSCYDRLTRIAAARGWTLPSIKTFTRRIERELPRVVRVLARDGEDALMRAYPAQERDRSMLEALFGVNADGHRWDIHVTFPDGTVGRPCIIGWQDLYSGKLLAWRLCDQESSDAVRLSFGDLVRLFGVPRNVWLDNGRAFASKWITGGTRTRYRFKIRAEDPSGIITTLVGADGVHWVTPYHGQAKPIERAWRDFCDRIAKHPAFAGAYTGNNPTNKPENYGSRAVDWATFERVVTDEIHAHNARTGRRATACAGRSFDQTFADSYARIVVRRATDEQLRQLLLAAEAVTADARDGSVSLAGNRYWIEALSEHAGRKVVVRVDPHYLQGEAHVYALDGTFIATAPCVAAVGFADVNAAREHARSRRQHRRAAKEMLEAERRMTAAEVAAQLPTTVVPELPAAPVIAPIFGKHGKKPAAAAQPIAATGTDGPSRMDLWLLDLARQRAEDAI